MDSINKPKPPSKQPEYIREYFYNYYHKNKERFWSSCVHCIECDMNIKKSSYLRHLRTKRHINNTTIITTDKETHKRNT